ncbi:trans-sulfuration enzyme family protein [Zobellella iuensis]|uniref:Aminotransferase class I/II-fold pyridoxal phosphate-dependent enzyme n=1 Tax=Zobellella iuensis TaxID=2803811 RepID=A0ABS1QVN8_9GAMM|nr:aminotransferase class I/II-fold pyridoxal phosphate-dependent enzyme [Zobellella iuensis]MBL1378927.1 aminotransferase class I/II-fold pyridoxal phosphate-dependent enzyme [Zobellella iuensis]
MDVNPELSPLRHSHQGDNEDALVREQLRHFGIDPASPFGRHLAGAALNLYRTNQDIHALWQTTRDSLDSLPAEERISRFNAKKFLAFQLAKVLDNLQAPFRAQWRGLGLEQASRLAKGAYPLFDRVPMLFGANPPIVRTATYVYACTEWIDDAFHGRESTHPIYSRLLNPTALALANTLVELEAGPDSADYLALTFNSGMAAIDALLGTLLERGDILLASRNLYGGVHQLLQDYYARPEKLGIRLEWIDGTEARDFRQALDRVRAEHHEALAAGARLRVYLESPCNPHGLVLDVPGICRLAHQAGAQVMLDATLATPVLFRPLQQAESAERPDFVVHSCTKDMAGTGSTTAGAVIGPQPLMFLPKGEPGWQQTLFWQCYYIKGAFLDADKAYEVLTGLKTLELRMLAKGINTLVLARFLAAHPDLRVVSHALDQHPNAPLRQRLLRYGLPCPLFTFDLEGASLPRDAFVRFFDALEPAFGHMVSLGQTNTLVLCPALTSHSELDAAALAAAGIHSTSIRVAVGIEPVRELIAHLVLASRRHLDPVSPGFSQGFMAPAEVDTLVEQLTLDIHRARLAQQTRLAELL